MIDRTTKLRWRRRIRQSRRQVEDMGLQAEENLERHLFRRVNRLTEVRRFIAGWLILMVVLIASLIIQNIVLGNYYQTLQPVAGGTFNEGILGSFTNANPLYANGLVDSSVSRLVFSGLLKTNQNNQLTGDLADKWHSDDRAVTFTIQLRHNLFWHDGQPLTADDVVFTYKTIQNPDAKSSLFNSWQGIKVVAKDKYTVVFTLPNALGSFPYSLTNGIVPKHLLSSVPPTQLRSVRFNSTNAIGSGPFKLEKIEVSGDTPETREEKIGLKAFDQYYGGRPNIDFLTIHSFRDEKHMIDSYNHNELDAMVGLDNIPDNLAKQKNIQNYNIPISGEVVVFLKTTAPNLKDFRVRRALAQATKQADIINNLTFPVVIADEPLLKGQTGYDPSLKEYKYNLASSDKLLNDAGWVRNKQGMRMKGGQPLIVHLLARNSSEYTYLTQKIQTEWQGEGVTTEVELEPAVDLQGAVARHEYDALLYGISIGPDPDVFVYWHSSQADPHSTNRLNLSEYKSLTADRALEAGRSRTDPTIRRIKYKPFLQAWRDDVPAIVLYQPRFLYISRKPIFGFDPTTVNTEADRFSNVNNWMIRQAKVAN
ncbi:MAG TPA: ABC transporter substrate-binding protein [Candidatus Saccharimonadales bacterium]|nr:ABC transporter substrate-binding protein [Candidatus Saccharimonadales bacterium]